MTEILPEDLDLLEKDLDKEHACEHSRHQARLGGGEDLPAAWIVVLRKDICCKKYPASLYVCNRCFYRVYVRADLLKCIWCGATHPPHKLVVTAVRIR